VKQKLVTETGQRLKHGGSPLAYSLNRKGQTALVEAQTLLVEHIKKRSEDIVLLNPKLFKGLLEFYMNRNRQLENRKFTAYPVRKE